MNNYPKYRVFLAIFAIAVFSISFLPSRASALTMTPTRFELRGNPGDVIEQEVMLINEGDVGETFYSSYSNFEAQGETGSPAFTEPKDGLGTWMSTGTSSMYVAPHEQKKIPFKITIPNDADPGGHFAVIFWGTSPPGGQTGVSVGSKTGILVLLSVNGDVKEEAGLLGFNTSGKKFWYNTLPVTFEYRLRNDGGDRIKPEGKITIHNTLYIPTEKLDANPVEGNVLPSSTRKISSEWIEYERPVDYIAPDGVFNKFWSNVDYQWKNFAVGLYFARLNIAYGTTLEHAKDTTVFFIFPWQLVLVLALLFVIIFWGGKRLVKRYNRYIIEKARSGK